MDAEDQDILTVTNFLLATYHTTLLRGNYVPTLRVSIFIILSLYQKLLAEAPVNETPSSIAKCNPTNYILYGISGETSVNKLNFLFSLGTFTLFPIAIIMTSSNSLKCSQHIFELIVQN